MSALDRGRAARFLRRRHGVDHGRDEFVDSALAAARAVDHETPLSDLIERGSSLATELAGIAAAAEQRRDGLGLTETMRLVRSLEEAVSLAALAHRQLGRIAAVSQDREIVSQSGGLG